MGTTRHMRMAVCLSAILGVAILYAQPFAIGERTTSFFDSGRNRTIGAQVRYPADQAGVDEPCSSGQFPVLVMGHGFVMGVEAYANLWEYFVPNGYIMVLPTTETGLAPDHAAFGEDLSFLSSALQLANVDMASPFFDHVLPTCALMGHSMGGGASFLGASGNSTISALVNLAAAETNPSAITAAAGVLVPTLVFAASEDCVTPIADHQQPMFDALNTNCQTLVTVQGGGHCYFAESNFACSFGESTCGPTLTITREAQHAVANDFAALFLDHFLKGDAQAYQDLLDSLATSNRITFQSNCLLTGAEEMPDEQAPLHPVPTSETLLVSLPSSGRGVWSIVDGTGHLVMNGTGRTGTISIDVSGLVNGIYHFVGTDDAGTQRLPFIVAR